MRGFQTYGNKHHGTHPTRPRNGKPKQKPQYAVHLRYTPGQPWTRVRGRRITQLSDGTLLVALPGDHRSLAFPKGQWR